VTGYTRWEEDLTGEDPRFCNSDGDQLGYVKPNGTAWEAGYGGKLLGLRASKGKAMQLVHGAHAGYPLGRENY
jgi:hypothetical protein